MHKINILDSAIYNLIAAGEVIERPASVIKELIENSLDAKAKSIEIEIKKGGIDYIRVTDDGEGISKEDLERVFLPHATSKISSAEDLARIFTLGFRGEALASIGAVSGAKVFSRQAGSDFGFGIDCDSGAISQIYEKGMALGTVVMVEGLFSNIPARAKFLKTPSAEESAVSNLVLRMILTRPEVAFKYTCDDKTIYQTQGKGITDAIINVYGKNTLENMFYIHNTMSDIVLEGYLCRPNHSKPNRTYQTLTVNGRYIINSTVSSAVQNAYGEMLMKRQYPMYILNLTMPCDLVDINVHPNKLDVRFFDNSQIYKFIYNSVKKALIEDRRSEYLTAFYNKPKITQDNQDIINNSSEITANPAQNTLFNYSSYEPSPVIKDDGGKMSNIIARLNKLNQTDTVSAIRSEQPSDQLSVYPMEDYSYIGNAFSTYLFIQSEDEIIIIDQHAAHERILYDKLMGRKSSGYVQNLLVPHVFEVNHQEEQYLEEILPTLIDLGFGIESFGNFTYKIGYVPSELSDINLKLFVNSLLEGIPAIGKTSANDFIKEKIAGMACKAAVKAGDRLSNAEINKLLDDLKQNKTIPLCPHGRPVFVRLSKRDLEKMFKRIV